MKTSWYEMRVPGSNSVYCVKCDERSFRKGLPEGVTFSPIDRETYARRVEAETVQVRLEYQSLFFS
ncbi:hypothetical protein KY331_02775 [Candidatus Woesearchaeota archaeon]|nr:hypothetical protein [Candidatus Woesearchaeota archaeon]